MYFIETHRNITKHLKNNKANSTSQKLLTFRKTNFSKDVLKAFLSADIPIWKLRYEELKKLFESIAHPLPAGETCRLHIDELHHEEIFSIRDYIQDQPIFLIVDETEISRTKYVNVLIRLISKPETTLLFECCPQSSNADVLQILYLFIG